MAKSTGTVVPNKVQPTKVYPTFEFDTSVPDVQPTDTLTVGHTPTGAIKPQDLEPTNLNAVTNTVVTPTASNLESVGATMFTTALDWYHGFEEDAKFDADPYFNAKESADEWFKDNDRLSEHESEYLYGAKSLNAMQYRQERLTDQRMRQRALADNPIVGSLGYIADADLLTGYIPMLGQATWAKKLAVAGGAATAATTVNVLNDNSIRTTGEKAIDTFAFGIGGLFAGGRVGTKAGQPIIDIADEVAAPVAQEIKPRVRVSSEGSAATDKPRMRMYAGIDQAVVELQDQQRALAAKSGGSLGTVEVMGVPLEIPISAPVRGDLFELPDWATRGAAPVTNIIESTAETLFRLTHGDVNNPLNNLLASARTQGENAAYTAAAVEGELSAQLVKFEDALDDAVTKMHGTSGTNPLTRSEHLAHQQDVMLQVQRDLQRIDREVIALVKAGVHVDESAIIRLIKQRQPNPHLVDAEVAYIKSGFANTAYDHFKRAGLMSDELADELPKRATYTPLRHSYERMNRVLREGVEPDTLFNFIGDQILHRYPRLAGVGFSLNAKQLGMHFYKTLEKADTNLADVVTSGISSDKMRQILQSANLDAATIETVVGRLMQQSERDGANTVANLRSRMDWDWGHSIMDAKTGRMIEMSDIVDNDLVLTLNDYVRNTSKRVGAAKYGFDTPAKMDEALEAMIAGRPSNVSVDSARNFARGVKAQITGAALGEPLAPAVRSANTIAGSMVLGGSGIWSMMELTQQVFKVGMLRSLPHIAKGLKHAITPLKGISKSDATALADILSQRLSSEGRWRKWSMRYEDNFDVTKGIHEQVSFYGQSTRFANGSEYVKRFQVGMLSGVITSAFEGAAKGSAKDIKYLQKTFKFSDDLIREVTTEWGKYGQNIDTWAAGTRLSMEQKVFFEVDNMAHTIRAGETPRWMEHSTVGKILAPFLSFALAMQQKVLKHTIRRDGMAGLALVIATQLPVAVLLGATQNIRTGKEWDENLASKSMQAMSVLGAWGLIGSIVDQGGYRGGSSIFAPMNKAFSLANKIAEEDVAARDVKGVIPIVGATTALDFVLSIYESETD